MAGLMVAGVVGFIGSYHVKKLMEEARQEVRVIDNRSTGKRENLAPVLERIDFQLCKIREDVAMEMRKKVTWPGKTQRDGATVRQARNLYK